jgi:hypothetical protein
MLHPEDEVHGINIFIRTTAILILSEKRDKGIETHRVPTSTGHAGRGGKLE